MRQTENKEQGGRFKPNSNNKVVFKWSQALQLQGRDCRTGQKSKTQLYAAYKMQIKNPTLGLELFKLANLVLAVALSNRWQGLINEEVVIEDT